MQAIETKFLPYTNNRPMRIKATCARGSITITVDSPREERHIEVAKTLIAKFIDEDFLKYKTPTAKNPWARPPVTGQLKNGNYVHVFIN